MFDFNIWFKGMIIENVKAESLRKAKNAAKKMFSQPVVVNAVNDTQEGHMSAKAKSLAESSLHVSVARNAIHDILLLIKSSQA